MLYKGMGLNSGHGLQIAQIALLAHQHDNDVAFSVVTQLLQPALHIVLCQVLGNVIPQQRTQCTVIVSRGDVAVALLASSVPTLAFMVLPLTWMLQVANSMPMVLLLSRLNSLWVKQFSRLLFPTPMSPLSTTLNR